EPAGDCPGVVRVVEEQTGCGHQRQRRPRHSRLESATGVLGLGGLLAPAAVREDLQIFLLQRLRRQRQRRRPDLQTLRAGAAGVEKVTSGFVGRARCPQRAEKVTTHWQLFWVMLRCPFYDRLTYM